MITTTTEMLAVPVDAPAALEHMRQIRNMGVGGYSHANVEISRDEQAAWWAENRDRCHAWLYYYRGGLVGFGMIRQAEDGWHPSAGVAPVYRGRGFGSAIVDDLAIRASGRGITLTAQARIDNPAAVATHHPEFWTETHRDADYVYFASKESV